MTSNNPTMISVQPEEAVSDKLNQSAAQSPLEPKQSIDSVLAESKRLIKSGHYKKAFNFVEGYKGEGSYIPPIANIKLCRRMVICLTRICTRYLTKGDLHRVDHFLKLMNKSYDYMQTWHDLLCSYVSKTNPKFSHFRKILTEASDMYEETLETGDVVRVKLNLNANANNHTNTSYLSTAESRETKPSGFLNKLKQNASVSKDAGRIYLEDISNLEQDSRLVTETLSGQEINACFHLDEFVKYYLVTLLNWANFYKKANKKYDSAYRFLLFAHKVAKVIDSCLDPETLQLLAKIRLALGVLYSEFGKQKEALEIFESALNTLQIELSLRINRNKEKGSNIIQMEKLKESIRHLILACLNMAIIYEQRDNYARTLECLRLGAWFAGKFLATDDEILHMVNTQYNIAMQRYDKYLKELGELERVVTEKTNLTTAEDAKETKESDHVAKMNYHLYSKFNYDKLNASQFIVIASPSAYDKDANPRNNKSEFLFDEKTEVGESRNWSKLRDHRTEGSFARTATIEDIDMPHTSSSVPWKRPSHIVTKTNIRDKKKDKFKLDSTGDDSRFLISRKYQTEGTFDHEKEEFELDSDEEREYIEKLNRNIKEKKKVNAKKNGAPNKMEYLDIDTFFNKVVDKKIKDKEEELKLNQPKEFKKIVKDYGYFLKNETFDGVEFGFATRALTAKARENLGDYTVETKYKPPSFKVAQRNEVKLEAQLVEARFETETRVNQRNFHLKNFFQAAKSPQAKSVKFATSPTSGRETKVGTLVTIDEQQPSTTRSAKQAFSGKHTFTGILMKHHEDLGLNGIHGALREREKKSSKLLKEKKQHAEMTKLGLFNRSSIARFETPKGSVSTKSRDHHREVNPEEMGRFSQTTKNTIQLWMESIEKNIEEDEDIKKRIEENKPLVQTQKSAEKFLKVPEDLAKSTQNLSIKAQSNKKMWNFSQLVKNSHLLNKKTVTIKAP